MPPGLTNLPGQLASLKRQLLGATALPTTMQQQTLVEARRLLAAMVADANAIAGTELPRVQKLLEAQGMAAPRWVAPPPLAVPGRAGPPDAPNRRGFLPPGR
jgi:hypothetical protein